MKKTNVIKAAIAAVAVVGLVGVSSPAFADQGAAIIGSQAYYKTSGKVLSATDTDADGKSAIAQVRYSGGSVITTVTNGGGKNTTKSATVNVPAGRSIQIRAGVINQSSGGSATYGSWVSTTS